MSIIKVEGGLLPFLSTSRTSIILSSKNTKAYFPEQLQMATSANKSIQLYMPKAKVEYTGFFTYVNGLVKACMPLPHQGKKIYCT